MSESNDKSSSSLAVHVSGILLVAAVVFLARYLYQNYMLSGSPSASQWQLGMGLAGGTLVILLIVFPFRRRLRQGPAKSFEPWMIMHAYLGAAAGIILLHHGFYNFSLDLRGILLSLLVLTILLGMVLMLLRKSEQGRKPSRWTRKLSSFHLLCSLLTGMLLLIHVLFDAVVRQ